MREVHVLHTHTPTYAQVVRLVLVSVGKSVLFPYLMLTLESLSLATKVVTTWIGMPSLATYLTV